MTTLKQKVPEENKGCLAVAVDEFGRMTFYIVPKPKEKEKK